MVGVPPGEARLVIEAGSTRIPVHVRIGNKTVNTITLLEVLPVLIDSLTKSLERLQARETADWERRVRR